MAPTRKKRVLDEAKANCQFAFFISHVHEDNREVARLESAITAALVELEDLPVQPCFCDLNDWEHGNRPSDVLRRNLLASQFFLGWVTPQYLESGRRGWVWFELAYAEQIEQDQQPGQEHRFPFIVPVFRGVDMDLLKDTPWLSYYQHQIEPFQKSESLTAFLKRFVPRLIAFYKQELKKWKVLANLSS